MPTVLRVMGYEFYFYAYDCREPRHMHVDKGGASAKFWLDPVRLARNRRFRNYELRKIEKIIAASLDDLRQAWDDFCNSPSIHYTAP